MRWLRWLAEAFIDHQITQHSGTSALASQRARLNAQQPPHLVTLACTVADQRLCLSETGRNTSWNSSALLKLKVLPDYKRNLAACSRVFSSLTSSARSTIVN
jgi:hypothetical protein